MNREDTETLELGIKSARVASFVGMTQVASIAISGVMVVLLFRMLNPTNYGIYTLAFGVGTFFGAFGMFGLNLYLNKSIPHLVAAKKKEELAHVLGTSFLILFVVNLMAALIGVLFSGIISTYAFHSPDYTGLIDVSLLSVVFLMLMYLASNTLIGFKDGFGSAATYLSGNITMAAASIMLVASGHGAMGAIEGIILGASVGICVGFYFIRKHSKISIEFAGIWKRTKEMFDFTLPLAVATNLIPSLVNSLAIIVIGIFTIPALVGSFGVAYRVGSILITMISFVGAVLVQMFASALENKNARERISKLYNYSIYFGVLMAAPLAVFLIALPRAFAISLFPNYSGSVFYIPALSFSILIGIFGTYAASLAVSMGRVRRVLEYALLTGIIQLVLLLVLVPILSVYGAILGVYLAGSVVADYLYIRYMEKKEHIRTELGKVYRTLLASLILTLLLIPVNMINVRETVQLLIGGVVVLLLYPALLGITKAVEKKELVLLQKVAKQLPIIGDPLEVLLTYASNFIR